MRPHNAATINITSILHHELINMLLVHTSSILNRIWYNSEKPINSVPTMVELLPCRRMAIMVNGRNANRDSGKRRARRASDSPLFFPSCDLMFSLGAASMANGPLRTPEGRAPLPEVATNPFGALAAPPASMQADQHLVHYTGRPHHGAFGGMPHCLMGTGIPTNAGYSHEVRAAISANLSFFSILSCILSAKK